MNIILNHTQSDSKYIFTALEDDLPRISNGSLYGISSKDIVLTLDDRDDFSGRLFGLGF